MNLVKICPECGMRNNAEMLNFCMYCRYEFQKEKGVEACSRSFEFTESKDINNFILPAKNIEIFEGIIYKSKPYQIDNHIYFWLSTLQNNPNNRHWAGLNPKFKELVERCRDAIIMGYYKIIEPVKRENTPVIMPDIYKKETVKVTKIAQLKLFQGE